MCHIKKPLALAAGLNTIIFVMETVGGVAGNSDSLIMDGIHNFSDELALACLYFAYVFPVGMSKNLQRAANVLNTLGLIVLSGFIIWHSIIRILNATPTIGMVPLIIGILASIGNWGVAKLLLPFKDQNAAIKFAILHNMGDVYVSLVPVITGLIVIITKRSYFDPIMAIGIGSWLLWSTIREISKSYDELIWPENAVCKHDKEICFNEATAKFKGNSEFL